MKIFMLTEKLLYFWLDTIYRQQDMKIHPSMKSAEALSKAIQQVDMKRYNNSWTQSKLAGPATVANRNNI